MKSSCILSCVRTLGHTEQTFLGSSSPLCCSSDHIYLDSLLNRAFLEGFFLSGTHISPNVGVPVQRHVQRPFSLRDMIQGLEEPRGWQGVNVERPWFPQRSSKGGETEWNRCTCCWHLSPEGVWVGRGVWYQGTRLDPCQGLCWKMEGNCTCQERRDLMGHKEGVERKLRSTYQEIN